MTMDGPSLPRSIRWRLQLGVWMLPNDRHGEEVHDDETRWTMVDILERNKDLIEVQRGNYDLLVEMLQEIMEQNDEEEQLSDSESEKHLVGLNGELPGSSPEPRGSTSSVEIPESTLTSTLDPLSIFVKEKDAQEQRLHDLDLKYRKRRARRNRGLQISETDRGDTYSSSLTLGLIEKDLARLPPEHHTYHHSRKNFGRQGEEASFPTSAMERSTRLTEMLQIFAQQNPHIGYRQGMHEISSYLLLVIEMDLFDLESQQREPEQLLDPNYIAHDTYTMFLAVMSQLGPAYDVKINQGAESPMEHMAQSILSKIRNTANEKALHQHLLSLNCPPELYCTRWVRLMFSREVAGWKNVLLLWDIFMDLIAKAPITSMSRARYTRPGVTPPLRLGNFSLMLVMEATSASMILLQRNALLSNRDGVEADSIHRLMNISPLKNILPLTATLLSLMRRIQLQQEAQESPSINRKSFTISEMAQNAFSTGSQSILSILSGSGSSVSRNEVSLEHLAEAGEPRNRAQWQNGNNRTSSELPEVLSCISELDTIVQNLNDATAVIKRFLATLEDQASMHCPGSQVPPDVWAAIDQIGAVQGDLMKHFNVTHK